MCFPGLALVARLNLAPPPSHRRTRHLRAEAASLPGRPSSRCPPPVHKCLLIAVLHVHAVSLNVRDVVNVPGAEHLASKGATDDVVKGVGYCDTIHSGTDSCHLMRGRYHTVGCLTLSLSLQRRIARAVGVPRMLMLGHTARDVPRMLMLGHADGASHAYHVQHRTE